MGETSTFERSHDVVIAAAQDAVFDFVANPNSWPKWLSASHHIESPDRPLAKGETFRELWHTRKGETELNWVVAESDRGRVWVGETGTLFTGPIIVRYDFAATDGGTRFTRTLSNPARPKPITDAMIERIDEEAAVGLANVKRIVEEG